MRGSERQKGVGRSRRPFLRIKRFSNRISVGVRLEPIDDQVGDLEIVFLDDEDMAIPEYSSLRQDQRFRFATCVQQGLFGGMRLCCCVWIPIADDEQDRYLAVESDIRRSAEIGNPTLQRDN